MDKMSVVRSVTHTNAGHGMGSHWMLTGYVPTIEINDNLKSISPGSVVARMRGGENQPRMPAYVCVPSVPGAFRPPRISTPRLQRVLAGQRPEQSRFQRARPAAGAEHRPDAASAIAAN